MCHKATRSRKRAPFSIQSTEDHTVQCQITPRTRSEEGAQRQQVLRIVFFLTGNLSSTSLTVAQIWY